MRKKIFVAMTLGILLVASFFVYRNQSKNTVESQDTAKMLKKAETFFEEGNYDSGIYQLKVYLQIMKNDTDVWYQLGQRYEETGEEEKALECYREIAYLKEREEDEQIELNISEPSVLMTESVTDPYVEISVDVKYVKGMKIQVSGKNLTPETNYYGEVVHLLQNLQGTDNSKKSTDWFGIDADGGNLTLTGAFNYAVWQFKNARGEILGAVTVSAAAYRNMESTSQTNSSYATVAIPEDAAAARVTYWNEKLAESTGSAQEDIYINYGVVPEAFNASGVREYTLPDLEEGDSITYTQGVWQLHRKSGETQVLENLGTLELNQGETVYISGDLCGTVVISGENTEHTAVTDGEYGIRWKTDEQSPVFERVGDAVNLQFNYQTADGAWVYPNAKNDFDNIYPWSEMKLCAISTGGSIIYSNEASFATDGSCGDVMVEIPVHYFKREIVDGYEYIWISATEREGYQIDPAFVTENGIQEHIYVAAYLNSVKNESVLHSNSDTYVALNLKGSSLSAYAKAKGAGWANLDLVTLQTIQRLFMVETGIRNSQMLFMGNVSYNFGSVTERTSKYSAYAVSGDGSESNVIELANSDRNRNFEVGDTVTVFHVELDNNYYYGVIDSGYANDENWNRTVLDVTVSGETVRVAFSGPPVQIVEQETMIMHLPSQNGETDDIAYHTGETDGIVGKRSFKYRYMENIWGTADVILDGAAISNQVVTVTYPNGSSAQLSYLLPVQKETTSTGVTGNISTICNLGLDTGNAAIMLPESVGEGAIATDGFGDSLFYKAESTEIPNILVYGGAWDINHYAGLFYYNLNSYTYSEVLEYSGRLIYRENDIN